MPHDASHQEGNTSGDAEGSSQLNELMDLVVILFNKVAAFIRYSSTNTFYLLLKFCLTNCEGEVSICLWFFFLCFTAPMSCWKGHKLWYSIKSSWSKKHHILYIITFSRLLWIWGHWWSTQWSQTIPPTVSNSYFYYYIYIFLPLSTDGYVKDLKFIQWT